MSLIRKEALIAYLPENIKAIIPEPVPATEAETRGMGLETILGGKLKVFSTLIANIDAEAMERQRLSRSVSADIQQHYSYLKTRLYETGLWPMGASRQIEQRRSFQERQLDELNRENRVEEVECWKDLAKLNTERRMWLKQYGE